MLRPGPMPSNETDGSRAAKSLRPFTCRSCNFSAPSACIEIGTFWMLCALRVAVTTISPSPCSASAAAASAAAASAAGACASAGADRIIGVRNVLVPSAQNVRTLRERRRMAIRIPPDTRCDSSSPAKFARCSGSPSLTRSHGLAHRRPTGRRMPRPKERLFQDRRQTLATLFICSIIPGQFAFAAIRTTVLNSILPIGHALSSGCSATF